MLAAPPLRAASSCAVLFKVYHLCSRLGGWFRLIMSSLNRSCQLPVQLRQACQMEDRARGKKCYFGLLANYIPSVPVPTPFYARLISKPRLGHPCIGSGKDSCEEGLQSWTVENPFLSRELTFIFAVALPRPSHRLGFHRTTCCANPEQKYLVSVLRPQYFGST